MATRVRSPVRRARLADWWAGAWRWVLMAAGAIVAIILVLRASGGFGIVTAIAIAILLMAAIATYSEPMALALTAMPLLFVAQRLGFGGVDLSVSDAALAAAFGTAVLLGRRPYSRPLRQLLWLNLLYQFASVFTVIVNPQVQNTVEWFHAWLLVSGALIVGWALGRAGKPRAALGLMVATAGVIAAGTIATALVQYAGGDFEAVYPLWPWPMHKNAAGTLMAFAVVIVYANPPWARLPQRWVRAAFWLLVVATVMTQSRQALIGMIVAILVVALRRGSTGHSRLTVLLAIPAAWLVAVTVIEQIQSQNEHNSFFQRVDWLREVYAFWKTAPVFGHGLRFWYYNPVVPYQPPQAELEVAVSAGAVGVIGFIVMWVGTLVVLWRVNPLYGTLAFAITLSRLVQAQFDLFWTASQVSIPFVVAGICLGAMARTEAPPGGVELPVRAASEGGTRTLAYDGPHRMAPSTNRRTR